MSQKSSDNAINTVEFTILILAVAIEMIMASIVVYSRNSVMLSSGGARVAIVAPLIYFSFCGRKWARVLIASLFCLSGMIVGVVAIASAAQKDINITSLGLLCMGLFYVISGIILIYFVIMSKKEKDP